jgi:uncharacterized protein (TIGR04255 family)
LGVAAHKYKNPPIIEALCEFTFAPIPASEGNFFILPGLLKAELGADYAGTPREQRLQSVVVPDEKTNIAVQDSLFRIQMPTDDGTRLLSVGPNTLSVSMLKPYGEDGWEGEFLPRITKALKAYKKVAKPLNVLRIGVRYINQIQIPESDANVENYIVLKDTTPELLNAKLSSFVRRDEYVKEDSTKIIVTCAKTIPATPNHTGILLDIDTIWDFKPIREEKDIVKKVKELHRLEGTVFEALITDAARKLFDA